MVGHLSCFQVTAMNIFVHINLCPSFYFFGRHFKKRNYRSSIRNIFMSLGTSSTIVFQKDNASFHSQKNVLPSSSTRIKNED